MEDFEIISKLGTGSYSYVYKVRRRSDNTIYAMKKVKLYMQDDNERKNSLNEVRILASMNEKYVIKYKEAFYEYNDNRVLCIVMELAERGDL